jgi:hypothetical protein
MPAVGSFLHVVGLGDATRRARLLRSARLYVPLHVVRRGLPASERKRWRDLRAFRKQYGPILATSPGRADGARVLFAHFAPGALVTQVHGMLAKAIELRGGRPLFLILRDEPWHEEYLRVFGQRDVLYLEDYAQPPAEYEPLAGELLDGCGSANELLELRYRDASVGRAAASRVVKNLRLGAIDLDKPGVREAMRAALVTSIRMSVAAERLFDDVAPDKHLVYEQSYTPVAEFFDVGLRRGVDTVHWYRSPLEYSLLFRRYTDATRYDHFFSITDETWRRVRELPWSEEQGAELQERIRGMYRSETWFERKRMLAGKRIKTPQEITVELGLDPRKKTAVIYSHVLFDATVWYGTSLFPDYATWLVETVRRACASPAVNWVIKMHPENVTKGSSRRGDYELEELEEYQLLQRHFPELPPHVVLMPPENDTNPASFFDFADYAITVRGTVGLELPCFGVPVLTAGTGGYSGRGFTEDSGTAGEYLARLDAIHDLPPLDARRTALAQRFTNATFFLKPIPIDSFSWKQVHRPTDWVYPFHFALHLDSAAEIERAPDLRAFADWVLYSDDQDLMRPAEQAVLATPPPELLEAAL